MNPVASNPPGFRAQGPEVCPKLIEVRTPAGDLLNLA